MRSPLLALLAAALPWPALPAQSPLRSRIEAFTADRRDLERRYDAPQSAERRTRLAARLGQELQELQQLDFAALPHEARVDWLLFDRHLRRELQALDDEAARDAELQPLLPFAAAITALAEAQRRLEPVAAEPAAAALAGLAAAVQGATAALPELAAATPLPRLQRALDRLAPLRRALERWFRHHDGYDPLFSWWARQPYAEATAALDGFAAALQARLGKAAGDASLVGDPIGSAALQRELACEWIPYAPQELVAIAEREFAFCDAEGERAARELGCADWRTALQQVKQRHRPPGAQPQLIRELAHEAIAFLEQRDLVTVPPLAKECWRMSMLSREAQRVNPFFLGGETIQVSFPTDAMGHEEKLQSLRSNNEHFCRATVHHELIPGHWLQQYSQARHRTWREPFETPFWIEGWALYWEMRLYELGFAHGPEDRIGMLYWRKHRCARIVFSLNFHLGVWTGPQCVDYLVERVGHERAAATAEVRRSVSGAYGPLYQAAYMLGGLQLRALHRELVQPGSPWTEKRFHDEVLRQNAMPIAVLRAALGEAPPPRELPAWWFQGQPGR